MISRCPIAALPLGFRRERPGTGRHQKDSNFARDIGRFAVKHASRLIFLNTPNSQFESPWGRIHNPLEGMG